MLHLAMLPLDLKKMWDICLCNPLTVHILTPVQWIFCRGNLIGTSKDNKYVRLRGQPYIHICRSGVQTLCNIPWTSHPYRTNRPLRRPHGFVWFWAFGKQSSPKWEIPCFGRRWTAVQTMTLLALSSAAKSVTVQHTQTNSIYPIYPVHTLYVGMCG